MARLRKHLVKRGGVYYHRSMTAGRVRWVSLDTSEHTTAPKWLRGRSTKPFPPPRDSQRRRFPSHEVSSRCGPNPLRPCRFGDGGFFVSTAQLNALSRNSTHNSGGIW